MKIDITPDDLKMLINVYEGQMYVIDRMGNGSNTNPCVAKKRSRLADLKVIYEGLINELTRLLHINGMNGLRKFCKLHEGMTMDDAEEVLSEIKRRERNYL